MMRNISRREFSRLMSSAAAASVVAPLGLLNARVALANGPGGTASFSVPGFGPISPVVPNNTASLTNVAGAGDLSGIPLLQLPAGFQYTAISIRGDTMSDGNLVPGDHDGMAVFYAGRGHYALVRNHELSIIESEAGDITGCLAANGKQYDPFQNEAAGLGGGGTSTVIVDLEGRVVEDYVSLGGTIRNCAGGPTPWGSWISCEENVTTPASDCRAMMKHGYNFEVPFALGEAVDPIPIIDMGRMNHEAVSVDETTGYIYETEDRGDSAYYRFVPKVRGIRGFGALQEGGDLYAMRIKPGQRSLRDGSPLPTTFANGTEVIDTRGTGRGAPASFLPFLGQPLAVEWIKLEDVDPEGDTLRAEAQAKGASIFWRGEGAWQFQGKHYWVNSGAGEAREGQVMVYDPATETVTLIVESTDENLLDGPDNITVGRDGTLYLCEDGSSGTPGAPNFSQRVVGVDSTGGLFTFAQNNIDTSEFCGACFDPVGRRMFVNLQGIGITFAIWRSDNSPITLGAPFGRQPSRAPAGRGRLR